MMNRVELSGGRAVLIAHAMLGGVAFTGCIDTARAINRRHASRDGAILPFNAVECAISVNIAAQGGDPALLDL